MNSGLRYKEKVRIKERYGDWALVTGASSGIGRELAWHLADAGLHVVLHGRNEQALQQVQSELQAAFPIQVRKVAADLSANQGMEQLLQSVRDLPVGLVVLSAGFGTSGTFISASLSDEIAMLRLNCEAVLALTHHFSRAMVERKRGGIILMSSIVAFQGTPYSAHYSATKAYVQALAEGLAVELRAHGVDVLAAAPGPVHSGFGQRADLKMNMALPASRVGVPILQALGRKTTVYPGALSKLLRASLSTVPRWAKVHIMGKVMGGMTAHQRA